MDVLLYFIKYPEPGRVKTRLARVLGNERAARIYRGLVETNLEVLRPLENSGVSLIIAFHPPETEAKIKTWLSPNYLYVPQAGEDLGERLSKAFETFFLQGVRKVIAVGSDTLGLEVSIIKEAYEALDRSPLVLGPAKDGGYYLIGLSHPEPLLFQNIPWSTSRVLESTRRRAEVLGLSCHLLQELEDLDEIENREGWTRWLERNETDVTNKTVGGFRSGFGGGENL